MPVKGKIKSFPIQKNGINGIGNMAGTIKVPFMSLRMPTKTIDVHYWEFMDSFRSLVEIYSILIITI